jgi:hypothetical protein
MSIKRTSYLVSRLKLQSLHEAAIDGKVLVEGYNLKRLLFEEFSDKESGELNKTLTEIDKVITLIGTQSKSKGFVKNIIQPILKVPAKVPEDPSDQKAVSEFSRQVQDIAEEAAKVLSVIRKMQEMSGEGIKKASAEDLKKTLKELMGDDPSADKYWSEVTAEYETPEWFTKAWGAGAREAESEAEGMFGKVKGFFKSLFKGKSSVKLKPDQVVKGLEELTAEGLMAIKVDTLQKQLIGQTKEASAGATDITGTAMAGGAGGKEGEGEGASEKEVEAVEKVSIDFKDLIALLAKQDPDAAQEKIEAAADEAGVEADELKQIVQDPEAVDDLAEEDEDIDPEAIEQAMADAAAEMEEEGVAEEEISDDAAEELDPSDEIEAAEDEDSPKAGLATMYDDWQDGISKSAQGALSAKNRGEDLKTGMVSAVDGVEDKLSGAIKQAIADWRTENEESLVASEKFTTANFAALEDLVPDLATNILKKSNENRFVMTTSYVNKFVHKALDIMSGNAGVDYHLTRLNELAGLGQRPLLIEQSFDDAAKEKIEPVLDKAAAEVAMEFEADEEQAEEDLKEPAKQMGGDIDGADLALGLKYADEGDKEELYDVLEDGDADPEKVADVLKSLPKELQEDDPEDDPGEVEDIVDKAIADAPDPEEDEEAVEKAITTAIDDWEDQLSDRQKKRVNAKGRLGDLKKGVEDATPPQVDDPVDPADVKAVGDDWGKKNKIDDPKSPLGNPKNFSPDQMQKLIDLFPEIVDEVQDEGDEEAGGEELADAAKELLDKYEEFEEENPEAVESALEEPAEQLGIEPEKLADLLDTPEELEDAVEEEDLELDKFIADLEAAEEEVVEETEGSEEESKEVEAATDELAAAFEEASEEDEEAAIEALEAPAEEIGIEAEKLADILDDPDAIQDAMDEEEDFDIDAFLDRIGEAEEEVSDLEGAEGSALSEDEMEDITGVADEVATAFEEASEEDEEAALEALEEPADVAGIDPEKLSATLDDPDELKGTLEDGEIDVDEFLAALEASEEEAAEIASGEGEEADEEAADPSDELEAEMDSSGPIKGAIETALDSWKDSLEGEAGEEIDKEERYLSLKDAVFGAIDGSGDELSSAVSDEIAAWRSEHEETLVKGKKFAKKNFQSLEDMAPDMAAAILKKSNEAVGTLTRNTVKKAVHGYLDKKFYGEHDLLQERFIKRMNKLAGIL